MFEPAEDPVPPPGSPAPGRPAPPGDSAPYSGTTGRPWPTRGSAATDPAAQQPPAGRPDTTSTPEITIAFLLTQLGQHAADRYTARLADLDLTPPQAGILQVIGTRPGRSQQALSEQLGLLPSRVVAFVDGLEKRGLLQRRRNPADRRLYALYLTEQGEQLLAGLGRLGGSHEQELTAVLTDQQRTELAGLLVLVAEHQGLPTTDGGGYATLLRSR